MSTLTPKDHPEAIALFRSEIVGALTRRELDRGELALALTELSQQRFRPPRASSTKAFSVPTLERWYYAYSSGGLEALRPSPRSDRGRCRELAEAQRTLLAAIREEHSSASVPVILRTLVAEGRLEAGAISASSVRRFYQERGLDRVSLRGGNSGRGKVRLRWQAERPGALWHADVCHGAAIMVQGKSHPVRIHGILDDASRYVLALAAGYARNTSTATAPAGKHVRLESLAKISQICVAIYSSCSAMKPVPQRGPVVSRDAQPTGWGLACSKAPKARSVGDELRIEHK